MAFDLDPNYKGVPERIADFKAKHPEGCLRPVDPARPYWFETVGDQTFIVYAAAAYRMPDDPLPGIGLAWEPFPGRTPYTKASELQNAETSAWGRAIVATLASESKTIASAEDVRNRQADRDASPTLDDLARQDGWKSESDRDDHREKLLDLLHKLDEIDPAIRVKWWGWAGRLGLNVENGSKADWQQAYDKAVEKLEEKLNEPNGNNSAPGSPLTADDVAPEPSRTSQDPSANGSSDEPLSLDA